MFINCVQRNLEPGVFVDRTPAGETNAPTGSQACSQIRERGHRIAEEHHSETRNDQFGAKIAQRQLRRVSQETGRVAKLAQPFGGEREHGLGDIDPNDASGRTNRAREFDGRGAATAADIHDR